jgi:hypothetical protein
VTAVLVYLLATALGALAIAAALLVALVYRLTPPAEQVHAQHHQLDAPDHDFPEHRTP